MGWKRSGWDSQRLRVLWPMEPVEPKTAIFFTLLILLGCGGVRWEGKIAWLTAAAEADGWGGWMARLKPCPFAVPGGRLVKRSSVGEERGREGVVTAEGEGLSENEGSKIRRA